MRHWGLIAAVVVCGCDYTFQIDRLELPGDGDGGRRDGAASVPPCVPATPSDDFNAAPTVCGGWGAQETKNGALIARTGGQLVITPGTLDNSQAGCRRDNYDLTMGAFVEVADVATGGPNYTQIKVFMGTSTTAIEYYGYDGNLRFSVDEMELHPVAYTSETMRWWRLRRVDQTIYGDISGDGITWRAYGERAITVEEAPQVGIYAGTIMGGTWTPARFERFNVCP